ECCSISRSEAESQFFRKSNSEHFVLNGTDVVVNTIKFNHAHGRVIDAVCGACIAIARLPHGAGVQKICPVGKDGHLAGKNVEARYIEALPIWFSDKASLYVRVAEKVEALFGIHEARFGFVLMKHVAVLIVGGSMHKLKVFHERRAPAKMQ